MSNWKKFVLLAASLLLIAGIIGMAFTYSSAYEKTTIQQEKTIDKAFESLDVQVDDVKLEIIPTDEDTSKVTLEGKKYKKDANEKLTVDVKNGKLSVKQNNAGIDWINFDFLHPVLSLKMYIPKKQYEALHVSGDNGKIDVQEVQADHIDVQTGNGIINLRKVEGETVKADTDNGKLLFDEVQSKSITGHTGNGVISLKTPDLDRDIQLKTGNGLIDIQTKKEPTNTTFITNTGNGIVNILDKYTEGAVIGDGKYKVELSTGNGKISVTKG